MISNAKLLVVQVIQFQTVHAFLYGAITSDSDNIMYKSENDPEFVQQIIHLFVTEIPLDLAHIKQGIEDKNHQLCYEFAHKIKPSLDLLSLNLDILQNLSMLTTK